MKKGIELSVIIPIYNESSIIITNLEVLILSLEKLQERWEIIVINDGSTDDSLELLLNFSKNDNRIRIISYNNNAGRGYAIRQGFKSAIGRYIVTLESDLNYGTEVISELIQKLQEGIYDIVTVSPYMKGGRAENVPIRRLFLSKYGNRILSAAIGGRITTISGMTRGYKREVIDSIELTSMGKEIHLEIISKVMALGYSVGEIPGSLRWSRSSSEKKRRRLSFSKTSRLIISHLQFSFNEYPLLLFGSIGILLLSIGTIIGLVAFYLSMTGTPVGNRPIFPAAILLILFGVQIFIFSFLSSQIRDLSRDNTRLTRILLEMKGKIEEKKGKK